MSRSARMDVEDMQAEAAKAQARRRWEAQYDAEGQGDVSAPTARQVAEEELRQERAARFRGKWRDRQDILRAARGEAERVAARGDRQVFGRVQAAAAAALRYEAGCDGQAGYRTTYTA